MESSTKKNLMSAGLVVLGLAMTLSIVIFPPAAGVSVLLALIGGACMLGGVFKFVYDSETVSSNEQERDAEGSEDLTNMDNTFETAISAAEEFEQSASAVESQAAALEELEDNPRYQAAKQNFDSTIGTDASETTNDTPSSRPSSPSNPS